MEGLAVVAVAGTIGFTITLSNTGGGGGGEGGSSSDGGGGGGCNESISNLFMSVAWLLRFGIPLILCTIGSDSFRGLGIKPILLGPG